MRLILYSVVYCSVLYYPLPCPCSFSSEAVAAETVLGIPVCHLYMKGLRTVNTVISS